MIFLLINIPVQETIDYYYPSNLHRKETFKRLLVKVTTECLFQLKQKLYKQTEDCSMGGPLSVTLADIHMIRTENDVIKPLKPFFYKRYVDDIYSHRKKNCID